MISVTPKTIEPQPVHMTKSLSNGLAKQMWEETTWAMSEMTDIGPSKSRRTYWLKRIRKLLEKMLPPGNILWADTLGKGKDRSYVAVAIWPLEDRQFEIKALFARSRDFKVVFSPRMVIATKHLISRMFLRLPTTEASRISAALYPVAMFLIFGTDRWSGRNLPKDFNLLTPEGSFRVTVRVKKKRIWFVLTTFVHKSLLSDWQLDRFVNGKIHPNPKTKYLVLDNHGQLQERGEHRKNQHEHYKRKNAYFGNRL